MALLCGATRAHAQLPPPPVPVQNPITEPKRVLGKMLFWDTQLSSDNSVSCGTCHVPFAGGTDPRQGLHPGSDGNPGTPDDKVASPGVIRADSTDEFVLDAIFGVDVQVTSRSAPSMINAAYAPDLFWDGRGTSQFIDPETAAVVIPVGGALESQAAGPPLSDVEMAHEDRDWAQITAKLVTARPMALATNLPADVEAALASYPSLFEAAFGDPGITARRIAFAIATYERTLIADQTPFDMGTLTPQQQQGLDVFLNPGSRCNTCHTLPMFTDHTFRNLGLRPIAEDNGRQGVTGQPIDAGRFKVPTLRNVGAKATFMHNGQFTTLQQVINFYAAPPPFPANVDPLRIGINIPPGPPRNDLANFIRNGLLDPRVANETFPFDRPTLHTELQSNPLPMSFGTAGTGGLVPEMIAPSPPNLGATSFKLGAANALPGANAWMALSRTPPLPDGTLDEYDLDGPATLDADGVGTWKWAIPDDDALLGDRLYAQWIVEDPAAAGGFARTRPVELTFFRQDPTQCDGCVGDQDCNGTVDFADVLQVIGSWGNNDLCSADMNDDGSVDFGDLLDVIAAWGPCP
jgi:cytochrome c peroxidase